MLVIGVPLSKDSYVSNCGRKCKVKMSRPDLFMKQTTKLSSYLLPAHMVEKQYNMRRKFNGCLPSRNKKY